MNMPACQDPNAPRSGFSLVELLTVTLLLGLILSSLALVGGASDRAYRTGSMVSHLESRIATAVDHVVGDLRSAGVDTFVPEPAPGVGASTVQYVQAVGLAGAAAEWTGLRRLGFEYETGEVDDGLDNNGNGLVDEGCLVLTEDLGGPNERRRVLTRWVAEYLEGETPNGLDDNGNDLVDERGFVLERVGDSILVRLTLQRRTTEGALLTRSARTSATPRNRMEEEEEEEEP